MSSFEPWKAIKPSAPAPTGYDPLSEAFKNAVNAFGWPDKMGNYVDALSGTSTRKIPSAYLPSDSVERGYPVTSEQSRTAAIPTANQPSSSTVTGAAHQQLPSLTQVTAPDPNPQGAASQAQGSRLTVHPTTRQQRIVQQPTSPSVISNNAGLDPPSKRRRVTGTGAGPSETPTLPPTPSNRGLVVPRGAEKCLHGCIFVFTGELPNLTRPQAQRLIESHGGQVVLIPDKSTTHSVIGHGVTKNKLTILDRLQIAPLDEQGLVQMIQEMPANGRWEESPVRGEHSELAINEEPNTMTSPPNETVRGATQDHSEMPAPREDTVGTTDNDRTAVLAFQ
jgi:hypothetical protein